MNLLEKYAKKHDLVSVSVGVWPKSIGTPNAYNAYVHWKDADGGYTNGCASGWGQTMEEAILKAIAARESQTPALAPQNETTNLGASK